MSIELATPTFSNEQICAHRGASGSYPENTRAAFDAAASVGAGWIETDIQCLADGELVIFHDDHLGRTASGSAKVSLLSWPDMVGHSWPCLTMARLAYARPRQGMAGP